MSENLFFPVQPSSDEVFTELLTRPGVRIQRIVSTGQASPPGFWYQQEEAEWVLILQGEALLRFEDEAEARCMKPGDFVDITPLRRHRVEWTDPEQSTIWLAVFYSVA